MIIPVLCGNPGCANSGAEVNHVSGINPPDLDLFYESYDASGPRDHCPACGCPGVAQDPLFEHPWETKYYD